MKMRDTLIGAMLGCLGLATMAAAQPLALGTTPQGSAAYATAATIAKVVVDNGGPNIQVIPQGGPGITLPMVSGGQFDLSVGASTSLVAANRGLGEFEGRQLDGARLIGSFFNLNVGIFVPADSPIQTLADLKGARMPGKFPQQKNLDAMFTAILATAGLTQDDVTLVPVPNGPRGVDELINGRVDAAVFSVTSGKTLEAANSLGGDGIRWLPLADTDESRAALEDKAPGSRLSVLEPAANFPGITGPTGIYSDPFTLIAGANASEESIYQITRILYENADQLAAESAAMRSFDRSQMAPDLGVAYHDGAVRFYREIGLME
ncbi:TAXI family TRAP transporter solute-binding subunit [Pseudooceanicola atlanticus]|uniref:C4-dicarboxylate ABC transporter substrate-binding protein n=1 Tax=Pseudooceanicola atlanticus TaxID=1461694 RepID=A0A0A0EDE1_9RHOB|nr:TAXI family TRAP transporter solute-binding subunit [Pseudooceanicola atlanticus]KGM47232.1 hypothetical protein ATO9_19715 [Pseudooceanicola atlanticus]